MELKLDEKGEKIFARFRKLALNLPEVVETTSFGHPWFRIGSATGKMLSAFGGENDDWTACFKVGKKDMSLFLDDPRFSRTSYIGQHGWVSLHFNRSKINWLEVEDLLKASFRNNAPKKLLARLED